MTIENKIVIGHRKAARNLYIAFKKNYIAFIKTNKDKGIDFKYFNT